jgi:P-type Ca2+ transporter type 2C
LHPEVPAAVEEVRRAGIKVVMITGDHKITGRAIAEEAGIFKPGDDILTGAEIDEMDDQQLARHLDKLTVFARVTPEHKLRIVNAYRTRGDVIAMTGDGVNDAPALVAADLGIAMGKIGTEVAKEAADIVLLDDNFLSIVAAVEEGRGIYRTIKRVILYLFSTGLGELFTVAGAVLLLMPLPVTASQIIWLNFVTDGFLVIALALGKQDTDLLRQPFSTSSRYLLDKLMLWRAIPMGLIMMVGSLTVFSYYQGDYAKALTMAMTTLAIFQWFNAWNCRRETDSVFSQSPFTNKYLIGATVIVVLLQVAAVHVPFMQRILRTVPLTGYEWLLCTLVASTVVLIEEVRKFIFRHNISRKKAEVATLTHGS